ncbi:hypothetical protein HK103_003430 [Boothiomyces macroporosus]|uniref:Uncharacterized protein n=1 Tax=Boothiomyces macroporosus TaxID=261099 RepID=A0AAD5Y4M5_9FUNG|nr:hypothetical protein HK103_003430 [Boothiomyces macroporosus]
MSLEQFNVETTDDTKALRDKKDSPRAMTNDLNYILDNPHYQKDDGKQVYITESGPFAKANPTLLKSIQNAFNGNSRINSQVSIVYNIDKDQDIVLTEEIKIPALDSLENINEHVQTRRIDTPTITVEPASDSTNSLQRLDEIRISDSESVLDRSRPVRVEIVNEFAQDQREFTSAVDITDNSMDERLKAATMFFLGVKSNIKQDPWVQSDSMVDKEVKATEPKVEVVKGRRRSLSLNSAPIPSTRNSVDKRIEFLQEESDASRGSRSSKTKPSFISNIPQDNNVPCDERRYSVMEFLQSQDDCCKDTPPIKSSPIATLKKEESKSSLKNVMAGLLKDPPRNRKRAVTLAGNSVRLRGSPKSEVPIKPILRSKSTSKGEIEVKQSPNISPSVSPRSPEKRVNFSEINVTIDPEKEKISKTIKYAIKDLFAK